MLGWRSAPRSVATSRSSRIAAPPRRRGPVRARRAHTAQNETVLYGLGDLHLRVNAAADDRSLRRCGQDQPTERALSRDDHAAGRGHHRTRSRRAAPGSSARSTCASSRSSAARASSFVDDVVGGAIPGQFIPAIEKGVRQVLTEGAIAGFELQDVRVSVYDGKHHPVDSKEVAFVSAGRKAFIHGDPRGGADRARSRSCASRSTRPPARSRRDERPRDPSARASAARTRCPVAERRSRPWCRSPSYRITCRGSRH